MAINLKEKRKRIIVRRRTRVGVSTTSNERLIYFRKVATHIIQELDLMTLLTDTMRIDQLVRRQSILIKNRIRTLMSNKKRVLAELERRIPNITSKLREGKDLQAFLIENHPDVWREFKGVIKLREDENDD